MHSDPIRYGIVGLGRAGWNLHVAALRDRAHARIVAVADPVEARRDEAANLFGCQTYPHLRRLLKQADIDVVVIATPSILHASDSIKAFKAGKHVIVEKPMAMNVVQADRMIAAADDADRKLFIHQNYRFKREFTHLKGVVDSGILGDLYHIRNYISGFRRRNDWQTLVKNGGGVLNNTCPHYIDQALELMGSPIKQVMGDLRRIASAGDVEDHVKAFMRAENGVTFDMEISSAQILSAPLPKWILCGSCGTLTTDGQTSHIKWFDPRQAPPLEVVDGPAGERKYGNEDTLPWQEKTVPTQGPDRGDFYDNVFGVIRRNEPMVVTPKSVREQIRVIAMIRKGTEFSGKAK